MSYSSNFRVSYNILVVNIRLGRLVTRSKYFFSSCQLSALLREMSKPFRYIEAISWWCCLQKRLAQWIPGCFPAILEANIRTISTVGGVPIAESLFISLIRALCCSWLRKLCNSFLTAVEAVRPLYRRANVVRCIPYFLAVCLKLGDFCNFKSSRASSIALILIELLVFKNLWNFGCGVCRRER